MSHAFMASWFALLAQQPAPQPGGGGGISQFLQQMGLPLLMIMMLFFFMVLRPQQREAKKREELLKAIKRNDRVLTSGGIFGVVTSVQPEANEVTLRIDEKNDTKMRVQLSSIARVLAGDEPADGKSEKPAS
jgi:preprotein translocase subunit YajC